MRGLRIGGVRIGAWGAASSPPGTPSRPAFVGGFGVCTKKRRRAHPSGASGTTFEAAPGPA
eukprot:7728218-Alexandrium_andersonii.AAC.1